MNHDDDARERSLRDALGAIAGAPGEPDEAAAWARISTAAAAGERRTRRNRAALGLSGLALAGAAAALIVVLVGDGDDRESVEVVPVDSTTTTVASTTSSSAPDSTATTAAGQIGPGEWPARPLVVSTADGYGILLVDGDTGEVVRELARLTDGQFVSDLELAPDGTVYFQQNPPDDHMYDRPLEDLHEMVRAVTPTGEVVDVADDLASSSLSPAVSNDGSLLAYVVRDDGADDLTESRRDSVVVVDRATGETLHRYDWSADDPDFFHVHGFITSIDFAPDNESLIFTVVYEGSELLRLDLDADGLTDGSAPIGNVAASLATWAPDGRVLVRTECCYPDFDVPREVVAIDPASGEMTTLDRSVDVIGVSAEASGDWVLESDGTIRRLGTDLELRPDLGDPGPLGPFYLFDAG